MADTEKAPQPQPQQQLEQQPQAQQAKTVKQKQVIGECRNAILDFLSRLQVSKSTWPIFFI